MFHTADITKLLGKLSFTHIDVRGLSSIDTADVIIGASKNSITYKISDTTIDTNMTISKLIDVNTNTTLSLLNSKGEPINKGKNNKDSTILLKSNKETNLSTYSTLRINTKDVNFVLGKYGETTAPTIDPTLHFTYVTTGTTGTKGKFELTQSEIESKKYYSNLTQSQMLSDFGIPVYQGLVEHYEAISPPQTQPHLSLPPQQQTQRQSPFNPTFVTGYTTHLTNNYLRSSYYTGNTWKSFNFDMNPNQWGRSYPS